MITEEINIEISDLAKTYPAYKEGWNANQSGNCTIFANPYLFGENSKLWIMGWNSDSYQLPKFL